MHGRDFTWADGPHSERVVLINASAARLYWPGEDAVGKILMRDKEEDRVVGVVDDVHEETVEGGAGSQIYYPAMQQGPTSAQLVVRTQPATLGSGRQRPPRTARAESESARRRIPASPDHRRPRGFSPPLLHSACGRIRRPWAVAGGARHLRRHLLFGYAADAGDRYPHGSGRNHRRRFNAASWEKPSC